ncbi:MAG TPA: PDZ domain-containing protein [Kineosporiaceae bacterium]
MTAEPAEPSGSALAAGPPASPARPEVEHPLHWRTSVLLLSAFMTLLLGSVLMLLPVPFVVERPGPAINTLGSEGGHPLISVSGHPSYPAKGALDLTTVTVAGGPGSKLLLLEALHAWFDSTLTVVPRDLVYPPGQSPETSRAQDQQDMVTSQESATVAALHELGIAVPATLTIHSIDPAAGATPLRPHDVILAVDGVAVPDLDTLTARMRLVQPGSTAVVTVRRDGADQVVRAPTHASSSHRAVLGVRVDPAFHLPFQVTIRIDNVGGPSAGMMFALGIIDLLTPGDLTGGQQIAGTGTIDTDGTVGPIGGIRQKMDGARRAGASWFLAPADNCPEVLGHLPDGLHVARVTSLHEARQAVEKIAAGKGAELATCTR